jgi:peptide deformylase
MIRKIITVPDRRLRQRSKPVKKLDQKIKDLVRDLLETVKTLKEIKGVGLSAIQIGESKRIFVIEKNGQMQAFINPMILRRSKATLSQKLTPKQRFLEGCLSVPGYYGEVDRPYQVKVAWQDLAGHHQAALLRDKEAAYWQHEDDHLQGLLFTDRVLAQKGKIYQAQKNEQGKEELKEITFR